MARGYINIAIIKYWGKKCFNPYLIPYQSSISLNLINFIIETKIYPSKKDEFYLNDELQNEKETKKIFDFVNKLVKNRENICIKSFITLYLRNLLVLPLVLVLICALTQG